MQREYHRLAMSQARSQYTSEEIKLQRESGTLAKADARSQHTPKKIEMQRESHRLAMAKARSQYTPEEKEFYRNSNKIAQKRVRSEKACEQISDNQVSDPSLTLRFFCILLKRSIQTFCLPIKTRVTAQRMTQSVFHQLWKKE